ncbi:MAG: MFS transporter [Alphaproteobacteria bacterium]|nr:MFS transporter [Alphaproteobacteria bacterium]NCQ66552.1 MFS transporter [Alphaproteobacteria bacterium]NCT06904.1 MFS transporter [Alphaproteobacteria bacterium]
MSTPSRLNAYTIWFLGSLFYAYQYILRVLPNIASQEIVEKFTLDASTFGQFSGFYYIGYASMHIPMGILLDRIGPKIIMPLSMACAALGLLPLIYADTWIYPTLGRILIGMGSSGAILGIFKIIRLGFPEEKFTRMLSVAVTIGLLGAIYGGQPMNYMMGVFGWKHVIEIMALLGVILAIVTYFLTPTQAFEKIKISSIIKDMKTIFYNPWVVAVTLLSGAMVGPLEGFADVWGTEYLKIAYGYGDDWASTVPSFLFLGMCFGSPFVSYIADKTKAYFSTVMTCAVVMLVSFMLILFAQVSYTNMVILLSISGVSCAYQIIMIYKASTFVPDHVTGLTTACANMVIMVFGYVFHSSIGNLMTAFWDGSTENGIAIYSAGTYQQALLVIPAGLFLGFIGLMIVGRLEKRRMVATAPSS